MFWLKIRKKKTVTHPKLKSCRVTHWRWLVVGPACDRAHPKDALTEEKANPKRQDCSLQVLVPQSTDMRLGIHNCVETHHLANDVAQTAALWENIRGI